MPNSFWPALLDTCQPLLEPRPFQCRWATGPCPGTVFQSWDSPKRHANVYIALTHSGVTLAPLIGELAAMEIVDGVTVKMLSPYRPDRFS